MSAHANTGTVLDRILDARRAAVDHRKRVLPEAALKYGAKAATPLRDFAAALQFVNAVGAAAEVANHHPDIDIRWNTVRLALTTHDSGGITLLDLALAGVIDRMRPDVRTDDKEDGR